MAHAFLAYCFYKSDTQYDSDRQVFKIDGFDEDKTPSKDSENSIIVHFQSDRDSIFADNPKSVFRRCKRCRGHFLYCTSVYE